MNIPANALLAQFWRGHALWPFIDDIEAEFRLPRFLLWAIGSRETNLDPVYAQGHAHHDGHGWGLFGADDRWNTLDLPAFASDPEAQALLTARRLAANYGRLGGASWLDVVNAYGPSGQRPAYGLDVLERREFLANADKETPVTPVQIIEKVVLELEAGGYRVQVSGGWQMRGRPSAPSFAPSGLVCHHTATNRNAPGDYPSLGIVRDGRSDLPGPLSQFGLGRSGTVYLIAAGKANHAGGGGWAGLVGNFSVWGIEAENDGVGEPWPDEQVDAYLALAAALARHTGFGPEMICRHAEWTPDKIDPATSPLDDGDWIRARVAERLATTTQGDPRMLTFRYIFDEADFVFDGPSQLYFQCDDVSQITEVLDPLGVKALGKVSQATHRRYSDLAKAAGFAG